MQEESVCWTEHAHCDEVSLEPCVVIDSLIDRGLLAPTGDVGMGNIRELSGGVVTPDGHVVDFIR